MTNRPLSPHLQIYRWRMNMFVSIMHRATGMGLAFVGAPLFLVWIAALGAGPVYYGKLIDLLTTPLGLLVLFGLTFSLFQHLCTGVRHFYMDIGEGYDPEFSRKGSGATLIVSTLLTLLLWAYALKVI